MNVQKITCNQLVHFYVLFSYTLYVCSSKSKEMGGTAGFKAHPVGQFLVSVIRKKDLPVVHLPQSLKATEVLHVTES